MFSLFFLSCSESVKDNHRRQRDGTFIEYSFPAKDGSMVEFFFDSSGSLISIANSFSDGSKEQVYYDQRTGLVSSKVKTDSMGRLTDCLYNFHPVFGSISSAYSYVCGCRDGWAFTYYDSSVYLKEIMIYEFDTLWHRKVSGKEEKIVQIQPLY